MNSLILLLLLLLLLLLFESAFWILETDHDCVLFIIMAGLSEKNRIVLIPTG